MYKIGQVISPQSGSSGTDLTGDKAGPPAQEPGSQTPLKSMLVISGGEGYIDFRMGKSSFQSSSPLALRCGPSLIQLASHSARGVLEFSLGSSFRKGFCISFFLFVSSCISLLPYWGICLGRHWKNSPMLSFRGEHTFGISGEIIKPPRALTISSPARWGNNNKVVLFVSGDFICSFFVTLQTVFECSLSACQPGP